MRMGYISGLHVPISNSGPKKVVVLGSTGSIGRTALNVIEDSDGLRVYALAGARNINLLAQQAVKWRPRFLGVLDESGREALCRLLPREYTPEIVVGQEGYCFLAALEEADLVLSAQVGAAGLAPTLSAVEAGKVVALANKESMVLGGPVIKKACARSGAVVLPVDSEHNALFQALQGQNPREVASLVLTASGGPFRTMPTKDLAHVTPAQALKHPNWDMGAKISIDSATLMNKGLELIEAVYLFDCGVTMVEIVVHPQSIIHSMVRYQDGSVLAQLGPSDMTIPISYALHYPHRAETDLDPLDFIQLGELTFEAPREDAFRCLGLAREAIAAGPDYPVVLNAANEVAVQAFLNGKVAFPDIAEISSQCLDAHVPIPVRNVEEILDLDGQVRKSAWDIARVLGQKKAGAR